MRLAHLLATAALALAALAPQAHAQVRQGLNELNASASFTSTEGNTVFNIDGFYGRFLTDALEVGPTLSYTKVEDVDGQGSIGGFAAYHFNPTNRTVPFVGGRLDITLGDDTSLSFGGFGGAKIFVAPGAAIVPQAFVLIGDVTTVGAMAGISIFF